MIKINEIVEPVCYLHGPKGDPVGKITSLLQLNDVLIQIKKNRLRGYFLFWSGFSGGVIRINKNGKLDEWPEGLYTQLDDQFDILCSRL